MGEDSLDGDVHGRGVKGLKHNLSHLFPIGLGVKGCFSEKNGVFLRSNTKLIVEGMMPDLFHVIPVSNDSMFNGILEGEDTPLTLGFISNIGILLSHAYHHTLMTWPPNNGGKYGSWSIITSKACLAHARPIVNNQSSNFVVTHFEFNIEETRRLTKYTTTLSED